MEEWFGTQVNVGENLDKIVDEWTHAQFLMNQYPETYMYRMVSCSFHKASVQVTHWDTFVTEEDFATLARAGVSHVRVPIAYW